MTKKVVRYTPVAGTFAAGRNVPQWFQMDSSFQEFVHDQGFRRNCETLMFWDTELGGTICSGNSHRPWTHLADRITDFLLSQPFADRNVWAHSHAGQGMAIAAARYNRSANASPLFRRLVTIGTPGRGDIEPYWQKALERGNIERHRHLYGTGWGARLRVAGQGVMGHGWKVWRVLKSRRHHPTADEVMRMEGGHSGMLMRIEHFHQIPKLLLDFTRS